jgi:hypothetical protein
MRPLPCLIALACLATAALPARAEIEPVLRICDGGLCGPTYRAKVTPPEGWVEDRKAGEAEGITVLVPRGETAGSAEVSIFVEAAPLAAGSSLDKAMREQIAAWRKRDPSTTLSPVGAVERRGDMPPFRLHRFDDSGAEEPSVGQVAWGLDRDRAGKTYLVVVNLTAKGKRLDPAAAAALGALLRGW